MCRFWHVIPPGIKGLIMDELYYNHKRQDSFEVLCDFDGTVTLVDTTDLILSRFAAPQWEEVERQWVSGLISSRECMYRQVKMMSADIESLNNLIDTIPITPGFEEFVSFGEKFQIRPRIVSDGLDYVIKRVLASRQILNIELTANRLLLSDDGFELEFPYSRSYCGSGVCKCSVAGAAAKGVMILIGDGRSDLCLAGQADFVFARRGQVLEEYCREKKRPYAVYDDFFDIMAFFDKNFSQPHLADFSRYNNPAGPIPSYAGQLEID